MKQTFTHRFFGGRTASQIHELDFKSRTYRCLEFKFNQPEGIDGLPAFEFVEWLIDVDEHLLQIGFEPASYTDSLDSLIDTCLRKLGYGGP